MGFLKRRRSDVLELRAGDSMVCDPGKGSLLLVRENGEEIDLNHLRLDASEGSGEMCTRMLNPITFMHLASIVAATHGLVANEVSFSGGMFDERPPFICKLRDPRPLRAAS